MTVLWMSMFADVPAAQLNRAARFWQDVTGARLGEPSGDDGEYLPLVPDRGDRYLWLQRIGRDSGGWHLDLHVADPTDAARSATDLGATVVRATEVLVTLASPAGQPFCLVREPSERRRALPSGSARSLVDQICIDIPADRFDAECGFWSALTGWARDSGALPEFERLTVPAGLPLRILLQRLDGGDQDGIRAHADLAAKDRAAETDRHVALGATLAGVFEHWTTLRDPSGLTYCITDRAPPIRA